MARTAALVSAVTIVGLLMARAGGVMGCSERPTVASEPRGAQATSPTAADDANAVAATTAPSAEAAAPSAAAAPSTNDPTGLPDAAGNLDNPRFFPASKAGPVFVPKDVSPQQAAPPQTPQQQKNPSPR